jgi:hypothetical protein
MISGPIVPFDCWRKLPRIAYKIGMFLRANRVRENVSVCKRVKRKRAASAARELMS